MKNICLTLCILSSCLGFAQVEDDFSDGELLNNPEWFGDHNLFRVNDEQQLQVYAEDAGSSCLSTPLTVMQKTEWRCWAKLKFSPSANNNARFYLLSDKQYLGGPLIGYFIQLGEAGSDDAVALYRQEEENEELICRGTDGLLSSSFTINIKVVLNSGSWEIHVDPLGGDEFRLEAVGSDASVIVSGYIGFYCKYTSSNSKKMYFDNVYAGPQIIDSIPPEVLKVAAEEKILKLLFSESLDLSSAENPLNYYLDQNLEAPDSARLDKDNHSLVHLFYKTGFVNATNYTLKISNVCDLSGNCTIETSTSFAYFIPRPFDIVINEIMVDPTPGVNLPPCEYIELFNLSNFSVSMDNWILRVGNDDKLFQEALIEANAYLILCSESSAFEMSFFGPVYAFSSLSLTNSGQSLMIFDVGGHVFSSVNYNDGWYNNDDKAGGGWSLEQINPYNPCAGNDNWTASVHEEGGSPGKQNSVYDDFNIPVVSERACYVNDSTFRLYFSQLMDTITLNNPQAYEVDHGIGFPVNIKADAPVSGQVVLHFNKKFQKRMIYTLKVKGLITNCVGAPLPSTQFVRLGIPEEAQFNDLVINEILFNPLAGGEDYVEIYNRSDKIIELSEIRLASIKSTFPNPDDTVIKPFTEACRLCFPGDYILLSKDVEIIRNQYYTDNPEGHITMRSFPSYNNDEGRVAIISATEEVVDHFHYQEEMHHPLLNTVDGVSLERIHYDRPANDLGNWHSAAAQVGYGTPGYKNSQFLSTVFHEDPVHLEPDIIFPDNAYGDLGNLGIHYHFNQPGNIANVLIFNTRGYLVRNLVHNEILGTRGLFSWDGMDDRNLQAAPGIYIVLVEVFDLNGGIQKYKDVVVVGTR